MPATTSKLDYRRRGGLRIACSTSDAFLPNELPQRHGRLRGDVPPLHVERKSGHRSHRPVSAIPFEVSQDVAGEIHAIDLQNTPPEVPGANGLPERSDSVLPVLQENPHCRPHGSGKVTAVSEMLVTRELLNVLQHISVRYASINFLPELIEARRRKRSMGWIGPPCRQGKTGARNWGRRRTVRELIRWYSLCFPCAAAIVVGLRRCAAIVTHRFGPGARFAARGHGGAVGPSGTAVLR